MKSPTKKRKAKTKSKLDKLPKLSKQIISNKVNDESEKLKEKQDSNIDNTSLLKNS